VKLRFDSNGNLPGYHFSFKLEAEFVLDESGLKVTAIATNTDSVMIPIGIGWHPYFQLQSKVDNLILSFQSERLYKVNDKMIPTGENLGYSEFQKPKEVKDMNLTPVLI